MENVQGEIQSAQPVPNSRFRLGIAFNVAGFLAAYLIGNPRVASLSSQGPSSSRNT
ncbi:MAG: hypothetical protein WCL50_13140 [Spirochaetota bacterium]